MGKFSVGALNVQTASDTKGAIPVDSTNFTVLRVKRDILRRSSIGGMFTHRTEVPGRQSGNDGYGVDATFRYRPLRRAPRIKLEKQQ